MDEQQKSFKEALKELLEVYAVQNDLLIKMNNLYIQFNEGRQKSEELLVFVAKELIKSDDSSNDLKTDVMVSRVDEKKPTRKKRKTKDESKKSSDAVENSTKKADAKTSTDEQTDFYPSHQNASNIGNIDDSFFDPAPAPAKSIKICDMEIDLNKDLDDNTFKLGVKTAVDSKIVPTEELKVIVRNYGIESSVQAIGDQDKMKGILKEFSEAIEAASINV